MATSNIIAVVLLCLSGCYCEVKRNGDELEFTNLTEINIISTLNKEFDGKGLEPWYDVAKSFVHTVQKDDLPYDDIRKIKDNDNFEVSEFLKGWELPFLVVLAIGILFAIIVPIVGLVFCCCRLAGNCGGEMVQKQGSSDLLKRRVFGTMLFIIALVMFTGCLLAFVSNDRITDTVKSFRSTPISAIHDAEDYFNETLKLVDEVVIDDVIEVLKFVEEDVVNLPVTVANDVKNQLAATVREPLNRIVKLAEETNRMKILLENVQNNSKMLQEKSSVLEGNLTRISDNLRSVCSSGNCSTINYQDALKPGANFSNLPSIDKELGNIEKVINSDFEGSAKEGLKEFNEIDEKINSTNTTEDIKELIHKTMDTFRDIFKEDINNQVNDVVLKNTQKWINDINEVFDDYVEPYDKYRYYAGVGLICLILLPVVLMILGVLCGVFGHEKDLEPTERGTTSHIGGNCLMAAVGFMLIFVLFLMLFTSICFIAGAHLEKGCSEIRDKTLYTKFIDNPFYWDNKYLLGDKILNNGSINLTVVGLLQSCGENKPLFEAIKGSVRWNLRERFNVRKELGDIQEKLNQFNVSVSDQTVLNNTTKEALEDLGESGVDNISFAKFFNETNKPIVQDLDELQSNLTKSNNTALQSIGAELNDIKADVNEMENLTRSLDADVKELQSLGGNLSILANETLEKSIEASETFKTNVDQAVGNSVKSSANKILHYVDQTAEHTIDVVENDLARCRILTDLYDAAVNLLCRETVFPFNGFWFAIGLCLFFYIPAIILSIKLAKHYRRMKFEEGFDRYDGHEMVQLDRNKPWLNQGNAVYPK